MHFRSSHFTFLVFIISGVLVACNGPAAFTGTESSKIAVVDPKKECTATDGSCAPTDLTGTTAPTETPSPSPEPTGSNEGQVTSNFDSTTGGNNLPPTRADCTAASLLDYSPIHDQCRTLFPDIEADPTPVDGGQVGQNNQNSGVEQNG